MLVYQTTLTGKAGYNTWVYDLLNNYKADVKDKAKFTFLGVGEYQLEIRDAANKDRVVLQTKFKVKADKDVEVKQVPEQD